MDGCLSPMRPLLQAKAASMENRKSPSGMKGRFRVVPAHGAPEEQACQFRGGRVPYAVGIALANECSSFPAFSSWHTPKEIRAVLAFAICCKRKQLRGEEKAMSERRTVIQHARFLCDSGPFFLSA